MSDTTWNIYIRRDIRVYLVGSFFSQKNYITFIKCNGFQYFRQLLKELVERKENHEEMTPENQITNQSSGRQSLELILEGAKEEYYN